jgi:lysophospholipase L1-like esterase
MNNSGCPASAQRDRRPCVLAALVLLLAGCGGGGGSDRPSGAGAGGPDWVAVWGTSIYTSFPNGPLAMAGQGPNTALLIGNEAVDQSFRLMIHPSLGGERIRLRFSNRFGDRPLTLSNVNVGVRLLPSGPAIDPQRRQAVRFAGQGSVTLPAGTEIHSDALAFSFAAGETLAVSFHVPGPSGPMSWHAEAFAVQYLGLPRAGDVTNDATGLGFPGIERGWFFLQGLEVARSADAVSAIAFFGDSITDGFASTPERNERYPDFVARRLQALGLPVGVVNLGVNSNAVTAARDPLTTGPSGLQRFAPEVLRLPGVRAVFLLLGTNDLSAGVDADTVFEGLVELSRQARTAGLCVMVSTILPRNDPPVPFGWDAATEEPQRLALNARLRGSTAFDAVVDLSAVMENPLLPGQPFQPYFVEGLHPNSLGMAVLADAIPLLPLLPAPLGGCGA